MMTYFSAELNCKLSDKRTSLRVVSFVFVLSKKMMVRWLSEDLLTLKSQHIQDSLEGLNNLISCGRISYF